MSKSNAKNVIKKGQTWQWLNDKAIAVFDRNEQ
jgi:hypothetical protein